jgi:lipoprotein-releasing system permease protein
MNWEFFIAEKIRRGGNSKNISTPIMRISIIAIALGVAVMILTLGIVSGFKSAIRDKISSFSSHVIISLISTNESFEERPFDFHIIENAQLHLLPEVERVEYTCGVGGILKTEDAVQGVFIKGVGSSYLESFAKNTKISGKIPDYSDSTSRNDVVIASELARQLQLDTGMSITVYFMEGRIRIRKFKVSGIVENSLESFNQLILCNIDQVQQLRNWSPEQIGNAEVFLHQFENLDSAADNIKKKLGYQFLDDGSQLQVETVREKYAMLFNWLSLFDTNTYVIIALMILVALVNLSSGLLILILEKSSMIGLLKSLGAENRKISRIFLYQSMYFIAKGLVIGNVFGISIALIQEHFSLITLNPETYYIDVVPIRIIWQELVYLNLFTGIAILAFMLIPAAYTSRVEPDKVLKAQ